MKFATKSVLTAAALGLGLAAAPASAQVAGYDRSLGYGERVAPGYDEYGRLNVFGARLEPRGGSGLVGGLGNTVGGVVGGVGGAVGGVVGGVGNAVGGVAGGIGNTVGGVVGGVGNAVGGTVSGVTGATDDMVTGALGARDGRYDARYDDAQYMAGRKRKSQHHHRGHRSGKHEHPFTPTIRN